MAQEPILLVLDADLPNYQKLAFEPRGAVFSEAYKISGLHDIPATIRKIWMLNKKDDEAWTAQINRIKRLAEEKGVQFKNSYGLPRVFEDLDKLPPLVIMKTVSLGPARRPKARPGPPPVNPLAALRERNGQLESEIKALRERKGELETRLERAERKLIQVNEQLRAETMRLQVAKSILARFREMALTIKPDIV